MKRTFFTPTILAVTCLVIFSSCHHKENRAAKAGIQVPEGFSAYVVADSLGNARHLAVNSSGDIFVKLGNLKDGKGMWWLTDADGDGVAEKKMSFADYPGTGICIKKGFLYSSSNSAVYRYALNDKQEVIHPDQPELMVQGLVDHKRDASKSLAIDDQNNLYVAICSYSDACREVAGKNVPCPLLDSVGGIWQFKADKPNQGFADGVRYATGLKGIVGLAWNDSTHSLYGMQHGRGQFHDLYPQYFDAEYSSIFPAETMYEITKGSDGGWPYIYYDHIHKTKLQAPEFGGDGKKTGGEKTMDPIAAFPAHLGPNDLIFYKGKMFPEKYHNGAFIAFHNQSRELHQGFLVAFVPFKNGKPSGNWEIFANNFAGVNLEHPTGPIQHRPCGLAEGPDGALYVADDMKGTIYRIAYEGNEGGAKAAMTAAR